ncbi:NADH:flavin oxidoreductase/NADH oxidase [Shewanella sp. C32]|uniref:NADH:flavin oxidoreductase/NADH oxidase n=1 Tax=Shewanella electrica TaxID=515560 RepID=A0ABT2FMU0_9GAMM|nr:NADH:flavin oxidoreductase/NADH oxidase [Shewanella electrica]MCH1926184.1 NADH:flavin oxidoreductase/NADH oxidase [Shewanella electrica]MCS4557651.1 NADH:flavin oxidoreductase/NADH oxidase [Shewanella electrica]
MPHLFTPITFGPLTLANRIVIAPMCMYSAENGLVQPWHWQHYGNLSQSGAGMLIIEASAVAPEGRISFADVGIWNIHCQDALGKLLQDIRRDSDMPAIVQIGHAGRKASCNRPWDGGGQLPPAEANGWNTLAPSAIPFQAHDVAPREITKPEINELVHQFVAAAQRVRAAGFDGIEIHAAHGYLLHQFLSPISNHRQDEYGGSLENRMRLLLTVFDAIKETLPQDFMVGVRISATDWIEGGWDLEQSLALAQLLDQRGCHYLHVSSGGLAPQQQIPVGPDYQVPLAQAIKAQVSMPVIAVGLITEPEQAEAILANGQADAIALARGILYNPRWPWHAAAKLGAEVQAAPQYLRCQPHGLKALLHR